MASSTTFLSLLLAATTVLGHHIDWERRNTHPHPTPTATVYASLVERQNPSYPTGPAYDVPSPISLISSTTDAYSENTLPIMSTYTAGTPASLTGAPPLPEVTLSSGNYPTPDRIPDTDSPQVQAWMAEIDWSTIPNYSPSGDRSNCQNATNAEALSQAGPTGRCWWTCGQCTRDVDITTCQNPRQYGHGYDDGPGLYTPKLLTYLESKNLKATFFLVGSRVFYRPEMVRYEYQTGHELSVHTWSHGGPELLGLTQMTNEQIVAELGWTRKIIKDVTGVTPTTMRPPYGDIDDRVRAISLAMGMIPVIWTSIPNPNGGNAIQWDSQDWRVHDVLPPVGNGVLSEPNQANFQSILDSSSQFTDHGVIALQHDHIIEGVNLAIGYTIPFLQSHNPPFEILPVMECQGRPIGDSYNETNSNRDGPWYQGGDVATRTSNVGFDEVSSAVTVASRTYVSTGTGTTTAGSGGGKGAGSRNRVSAALVVAVAAVGVIAVGV